VEVEVENQELLLDLVARAVLDKIGILLMVLAAAEVVLEIKVETIFHLLVVVMVVIMAAAAEVVGQIPEFLAELVLKELL
jgi:hypothetical protein